MGRKPATPSRGRQKIEIAKIPIKNHLQVTFSKRRSGLFKKASELCTLCGAEIAMVVFSPAEKVFSFGHPDVDTLIDRFLARPRSSSSSSVPPPPPVARDGGAAARLVEAQRNAGAQELNAQLTQAAAQLDAEKKRGEALAQVRKAGRSQFWWEAPVDELELGELDQLRVHLEELKRGVVRRANWIFAEPGNAAPFGGAGMLDYYPYDTASYECKPSVAAIPAAAGAGMPRVHGFHYGYGNGLF